MVLNLADDKERVCKLLGLPHYMEAMKILYADCLSLRRTARVLGVTGYAIKYRLDEQGFPIQRRGGSFKKPKGKFRFQEELIEKCHKCKHLKRTLLPHNETYCLCDKNKFYICERRLPEEIKGEKAYWQSFALQACYIIGNDSLYWKAVEKQHMSGLKKVREIALKAIAEYELIIKQEALNNELEEEERIHRENPENNATPNR